MISIADIQLKQMFQSVILSVCLSIAMLSNVNAADESQPTADAQANGQALYAKVGDRGITVEEYNQTYQRTMRQRYYHSKPPEGELEAVRQEIADQLITRELLLMEAESLGLQVDKEGIEATLAQYDQRYASSPRWKEDRDKLLGSLKQKLEQDDLLRQIESRIKNITPPTEKQVRAYYQQNPEKFTEPMQQKLSLILLAVDPSSPNDVWQAAMDTGQELVKRLHDGADFAEFARTYSADVSAEKGGDMGYVHREMLSEAVEKSISELQPGQISEPIRTLQGVAILRLDDRKAERLREFADVRDRARKLWVREHSETAWTEYKQKLRLDTPVTVFNNAVNSDNDV
jgi:parvulin-like peptidyl-prolyl isomerase